MNGGYRERERLAFDELSRREVTWERSSVILKLYRRTGINPDRLDKCYIMWIREGKINPVSARSIKQAVDIAMRRIQEEEYFYCFRNSLIFKI